MSLLDDVISIARKAGEAIIEVYESGDFETTYKDDASPLTRADLAANNVIVEGLDRLSPKLPILSEESRAEAFEIRRGWESFWLVDPLDGTKEFVKRNGEFTVNIALISNGIPTLGVVYAPEPKLLYYASKEGAFKSSGCGAPVEIHVAGFDGSVSRPRIMASRSHRGVELERFLKAVGEYDSAQMGSSLKLCMVAEGASDLYPRLGPTMEWDTAAADAIVRAAGGQITDKEGRPLKYNKEDLHNPYFFVFGKPSFPWRHIIEELEIKEERKDHDKYN